MQIAIVAALPHKDQVARKLRRKGAILAQTSQNEIAIASDGVAQAQVTTQDCRPEIATSPGLEWEFPNAKVVRIALRFANPFALYKSSFHHFAQNGFPNTKSAVLQGFCSFARFLQFGLRTRFRIHFGTPPFLWHFLWHVSVPRV